jgi:hypothetical protein
MACEIVSTSGGVFALWGLPTRDDVDLVVGALREAATACGHPVVYVTRVPPSAPVPDRDTRHHLEAIMPTVAPCFSSYHVVLEGVGFAAALKRGILNSLFQLIWRQKTFFVHASVDQISSSVAPAAQEDLRALLDRASEKGLLERQL